MDKKTDKIIKIRGFEEVSEKFKKNDVETTIPTRGSKKSAAYDFYSKDEDITIQPGHKYKFITDIKSYMLHQEVLKIYVRSSIGIKKDLQLSNTTGIIDGDYYENPDNDGNIIISLRNVGLEAITIKKGERIAQGMFVNFLQADDIESIQDRIGGIGSTNP